MPGATSLGLIKTNEASSKRGPAPELKLNLLTTLIKTGIFLLTGQEQRIKTKIKTLLLKFFTFSSKFFFKLKLKFLKSSSFLTGLTDSKLSVDLCMEVYVFFSVCYQDN